MSNEVVTCGIVGKVCGVLLKVEVKLFTIAVYIGRAVYSSFRRVLMSCTQVNVACVAELLV